jgi:hypothetical protein
MLNALFRYFIVYPIIIGIVIGFVIELIKGIFGLSDSPSRGYYSDCNSQEDKPSKNTSPKSEKSGTMVYRGPVKKDNTFAYGRSNADGSWEKDSVIIDSDGSFGTKYGNRTDYDNGTSSTRIGDYEFFDDED